MTTATQIIERAAQDGIKAKLWEKGDKCRIYARAQKGMNIYLECDGSGDEIEGAAMKVYCNTDQHPNWIKKQVAEHRDAYIGLFHAYVVEMYEDLGPQPNGFGPDINEMVDEARAYFEDK